VPTAEDIVSLYQGLLRRHAAKTSAVGLLDHPTHAAEGDNPLCGDHLRVELRVEGDRIIEAGFAGDCCAVARASATLMCELLKGGDVERQRDLAARLRRLLAGELDAHGEGDLDVLLPLRDVPQRHKCALLPWAAVDAALNGRALATTEER
jgi:nitrogen fixation protein NifU and related proteins